MLLEYDIEIKPVKLIKGQGLAKMMIDSHCNSLQLNIFAGQSNQLDAEVPVKPDFSISPWYADIVFVLQNLQPPTGLSKTRARSMKLKATKFCIIEQYLKTFMKSSVFQHT